MDWIYLFDLIIFALDLTSLRQSRFTSLRFSGSLMFVRVLPRLRRIDACWTEYALNPVAVGPNSAC